MLWGKESAGDDTMYTDPFAHIQNDYIDDVEYWKMQLNHLKSPETSERSQKSNKLSDQLLEHGHAEFRKHNWIDALNLYSRALCYAERGTLYEGLAYGNRAICFFQLGMFQKAIVDFDFAAKMKCPEQFMADVHESRSECQKLLKKNHKSKSQVPKLKLAVDKKFPCMANVLEIQRNKEFGRCMVAKRDIDVGQTVIVTENFASAVTSDGQAYCFTCQKTETNLIPCNECADVMFCNDDCYNWSNLHKMECQTCYHQIDNVDLKFVIQTVIVAIELFPTIESLMQFVDNVVTDEGFDKIPKTSNDQMSKYGIFLNLTPTYKNEYVLQAYQAFTCISLMPKIWYMFDTEEKQRFLMHLVLHHALVAPRNAFLDFAQFSNQITVKYVFDVLSIINHSCAPNLHFAVMGKIGYCVSVRPIKKGDQVFINYLGDDVYMPFEQRQHLLKSMWGFTCKCDKCEINICSTDCEQMRSDPSLKYVLRNYENNHDTIDASKRIQLKKQCIKFLKKYGHLPWTTELEFVINCFTSF